LTCKHDLPRDLVLIKQRLHVKAIRKAMVTALGFRAI